MESLNATLVSIGVVALAEIGDKTQLLALVLAAELRKPWAIIAGIALATLVNHFLAGLVGTLLVRALGEHALRWLVGLSFLAMALWMLIPDRLEDRQRRTNRFGAFVTTFVSFFFVEMGDKTQVATVALAARYDALVPVVVGTTVGMLVANVPAVLVGKAAADRLPVRVVHAVAAALFALLAVAVLFGLDLGV